MSDSSSPEAGASKPGRARHTGFRCAYERAFHLSLAAGNLTTRTTSGRETHMFDRKRSREPAEDRTTTTGTAVADRSADDTRTDETRADPAPHPARGRF